MRTRQPVAGSYLGGMRFALAALVLYAVPADAAQLSPSDCAEAAKLYGTISETMTHFATNTLYKGALPPSYAATPELRQAAVRADEARQKLIPVAKEYARTLEDLAYQLRVCARR